MRRPIVAVIGDGVLSSEAEAAVGRALGGALIGAGFRVVTGGLGGMMEAVCYGARHHPAHEDGRIIGIVPTYRAEDANPYCDVVIPTGLGVARNVLVVASADVVVAVGGRSGTLSEIAVAWQLGKVVIALGNTGWAGRLADTAVDDRRADRVVAADSVEAAVEACIVASSSRSPR